MLKEQEVIFFFIIFRHTVLKKLVREALAVLFPLGLDCHIMQPLCLSN